MYHFNVIDMSLTPTHPQLKRERERERARDPPLILILLNCCFYGIKNFWGQNFLHWFAYFVCINFTFPEAEEDEGPNISVIAVRV